MRIVETHHLDGPNVWSRRPVLEALLDLEDQDLPSTAFPGLYQRLSTWLPSLIEHKCGIGERGGFLLRLREGTWPGHILEHLALELQALAGEDVLFGKTRSTAVEGHYKMVLRSWDEAVARAALAEAWDLLQAAIEDRPDPVPDAVARLARLISSRRLPPGLQALADGATELGIPWRRLAPEGLLLGQGRWAKRVGGPGGLPEGGQAVKAHLQGLFPGQRPGRVPLASVLGSGPRGEVSKRLAGLLETWGLRTGLASSFGRWLGDELLVAGDQALREAALALLEDPRAEALVLESSGQSVNREALAFDACQVAVVTGEGDSRSGAALADDSPDTLLEIRRCGLDVLLPGGVAVLNAAEPRLTEYLELVKEGVLLYAPSVEHPELVTHLSKGGRGVAWKNGSLLLFEGSVLIGTCRPALGEAPLTEDGAGVLAAAYAAAWALGMPVEALERASL